MLVDSASEEEHSHPKRPSSPSNRRKAGKKSTEKKVDSDSTCVAKNCPKDPKLDEEFMIQCDECDDWFHGL